MPLRRLMSQRLNRTLLAQLSGGQEAGLSPKPVGKILLMSAKNSTRHLLKLRIEP
jgi:hypothetical protein